MPGKHIKELRQFVQLPPAQKRANWSELLVARRGHRMTHFVLCDDHGPKLENGKDPAVTSDAPLQEEDRTG
jgi:hypothetical protein